MNHFFLKFKMFRNIEPLAGGLCAGGAFLIWGLSPLYWRLLAEVPPFEIILHRIVWSLALLLPLVWISGQTRDLGRIFRRPRMLLLLFLTALLVAANWLIYIWAVNNGHLIQASLGYYINPMLNVWLGYMFLGESLRRLQGIAVALAGIGVAWLVFVHGEVPWISLLLAGTFGIYGLLKKRLEVHAITGLTFEALYCLPLVLIYFAVRGTQGPEFVFTQSGATLNMLLVGFGPVTAAPLIWFAAGAKRLRLATVGMLQFLAPTLQLTVALIANGETLPPAKIGGFLFIWAGVLVYIWDIRLRSKARPVVEPSGE